MDGHIDCGIIWMIRVYGCLHFMDVYTLWMFTLYGCLHFMDVYTLWICKLCGLTRSSLSINKVSDEPKQ